MDPNLTLAHITHNTAVGLLHQGIAYPSPEWQASPIRLPSVSSAETCMAAATEVAIIADKYLLDSTSLTNPQFAFCLFISGRMLLAHSLHYNTALPPEFNSLINSLMEISRRWNGPHATPGASNVAENLASKFAARLIHGRDKGPHALDIRQAAYSEDQHRDIPGTTRILRSEVNNHSPSAQNHAQFNGTIHSSFSQTMGNGQMVNDDSTIIVDQEGSPDSVSLAFPPLPLAFQPHLASAPHTTMPSPVPTHSVPPGNFFGRSEEASYDPNMNFQDSSMAYDGNGNNFEDLNSFFEYNFLPTQRVSMFSGQNEKDINQPGQ
jgi:hypothetical protein